ncbi:MAG: shikimate kinase [Thermoanaerobaculia bacterium]
MNPSFPLRFFIVGFIGAGKTTLGKNLSLSINYRFLDTDREIEKREGLEIKDLIYQKGEEEFRRIEWEYIKSLKGEEKIVVALSSGAGASKSIMDFIKEIGLVLHLDIPWEVIARRLGEKKELIPPNLKIEDLYSIYLQRNRVYKKAHIVVNFKEYESMEETILRVKRMVKVYFNEISYNF